MKSPRFRIIMGVLLASVFFLVVEVKSIHADGGYYFIPKWGSGPGARPA